MNLINLFNQSTAKPSAALNAVVIAGMVSALTMASGSAVAAPPPHAQGTPPAHAIAGPPLVIKEQGSFFVGGEPFFTELGNSTDPTDSRNPGTATINQTYVEFQVPVAQKTPYPIIMWPGGGHFGKVYDTTPDGREGWATYFVRKGIPTYNADGVNRGASSWDLTNVVLAAQGEVPPTAIDSMNRYSHELAWTQFRIGPEFNVPHPGSQFPTEAFDEYTNQLVPAFRDPIEDDKNVAAMVALLEEIGPAILLTWSQSGRFGVRATVQRPDLVKALILLEPAAVSPDGMISGVSQADLDSISNVPVLLQAGDFDAPRLVRQQNLCDNIGDNCTQLNLTELGVFGNSHVVMVERNNIEVADMMLMWLRDVLGVQEFRVR